MQVDRYERNWMWAAIGMLALFLAAIVLTAVVGSAHPPSHTETIDPETLTISGEFATPGVTTHADGRAVVVMRAELYVFRPEVIQSGRPARLPDRGHQRQPDRRARLHQRGDDDVRTAG